LIVLISSAGIHSWTIYENNIPQQRWPAFVRIKQQHFSRRGATALLFNFFFEKLILAYSSGGRFQHIVAKG